MKLQGRLLASESVTALGQGHIMPITMSSTSGPLRADLSTMLCTILPGHRLGADLL